MKVYLDTIGCRLNQAEIESYARQLQSTGHELVPGAEFADLVILNTCAVTAAAASDSRQKIRQVNRAGAAEVIVTGCWATVKPQEAAALPGVSHVVPNWEKDHLVADRLNIPLESFDKEPVDRRLIPGARLRTRAFIKVQDGCDNHCTFCITTVARGASRSRAIKDIIADVESTLTSSQQPEDSPAAQEIVLTGVHLGSWGHDFEKSLHLRDLIQVLLRETDVARLRLSSLEPWDLTDDFFELWQEPRLCRHLHLPLQSGSGATLRRMARKTTPDRYAHLVAAARRLIPDVAITTDIIAGFPGENEAEFQDTLEFVRSMHFSGGHVFSYSPRPGTAAARMPGQVPEYLRKERNNLLRSALAESAGNYQGGFIGKIMPVLWESATRLTSQGWHLSGLTDNYLRVHAQAPRHLWNQITPVHLTGITEEGMFGSLLA